ncbi:MAG: lipid-A-disaccharide synthase [Xanthomonadales bacterium]|nr:lipid-A-disaccharide synthase [Xanthomonadales bacterium]
MAARVALVAGEASGDQLGGALLDALSPRLPGAEFAGIGGPRMREAGLDAWWGTRELSVMGLAEVLRHLPRLLRLRRELQQRVLAFRPDLYVGIDAPDFNLRIERWLRRRGIPTAHYVSPTVWAWRPGRVRKIAAATDLVLCLFPFEPDFYAGHGVKAVYVGHPLADRIPLHSDPVAARRSLGLEREDSGPARWVALLPGSRHSEVSRLAGPMLAAAERLAADDAGLRFVTALADPSLRPAFETAAAAHPGVHCEVVEGRALDVMAAADVVVCASGTATLEAMLVKRPMVVVYRVSPATWAMGRSLRLMKTRWFALPNILAGEALVPELLQDDAVPSRIAEEISRWLDDANARDALSQRFLDMHETLRQDAAARSAEALLEQIHDAA